MDQEFTAIAGLLAEPSRAVMLLRLMNGRALPAGDLAMAANVSPQTASEHLAKLIQGHLVCVERQGRHRYYRLATTQVADAIEALLALMPGVRERGEQAPPPLGTLAYARTCYSHLAGWLGVHVCDGLQAKGLLIASSNREFALTDAGHAWLQDLGIPVPRDRPAGRQCFDWTERRPHLAGALGITMYRRLIELQWLAHVPGSRVVRVTLKGKRELWDRLRIACG